MLTNARNLTLTDLRQNFGLVPNTADHYFDDWLNHLPPLAPEEITALDRLATNSPANLDLIKDTLPLLSSSLTSIVVIVLIFYFKE